MGLLQPSHSVFTRPTNQITSDKPSPFLSWPGSERPAADGGTARSGDLGGAVARDGFTSWTFGALTHPICVTRMTKRCGGGTQRRQRICHTEPWFLYSACFVRPRPRILGVARERSAGIR